MTHTAFDTINNIYDDIKNRNYNNNVLFIKIEDLYDTKNIPKICKKINKHLDNSIDEKLLIKSFKTSLKKSYNRTNKINTYTYNESFKEKHYRYFYQTFPKDIFDVYGYKINRPEYNY